MTKKEAANFLNVTERTITNYICKGYLTKELREEDVKQLKLSLNSSIPFNKVSFMNLLLKVEKQEKELEVIKRILNIYSEPLNLNDQTLIAIYNMADIKKIESWPEDWAIQWVDFISRLSDKELSRLEQLAHDPHPWIKFYNLCKAILEIVQQLELKGLYNHALNHLLQLTNVWIRLRNKNSEVIKILHNEPFTDKVISTLLATKLSNEKLL